MKNKYKFLNVISIILLSIVFFNIDTWLVSIVLLVQCILTYENIDAESI